MTTPNTVFRPSKPPGQVHGFVLIVALSFIIALTMIGVSMMDVSLLEQRMAGNYVAAVTTQAQQDVILRNSIAQLRQTYDYTDVTYPCQVIWHPETSTGDSAPGWSDSYTYTDVIPPNPCSIPSNYVQYQANVENLTESKIIASYTGGIDTGKIFWNDGDGDPNSGQTIRFGDPDGDGVAGLYTDPSGITSWNSPVHLVSSTFTDRKNSEFVVARQPGPPILAAIYTEGDLTGTIGADEEKLHDSSSSLCGSVFGDSAGGAPKTNHVPGKQYGFIAVTEMTNSSNLDTDEVTQSTGSDYGTALENSTSEVDLDVQAIFDELLASAPIEQLTSLSSSVDGNRAWRRYFIQGDGTSDVTFASGSFFSGLFLIDGGNPAAGLGSTINLDGNVSGLVVIVNAKNVNIDSTFNGALFAEDPVEIGNQTIVLNTCSILHALQNEPMLVLQSHAK